jgi:hypothetical protein
VFNRFYRLDIHSLMVGIFDPVCEMLPPWKKELYLCTVCGCGGGVLNCVVDHILQFYTLFLNRSNLQYCFTTPNKNDQKRPDIGIGVFKVPSSMLIDTWRGVGMVVNQIEGERGSREEYR